LIEEGVIEPIGEDQTHWHFPGYRLRRVRIVQRLESDLGLNLTGAALALLEEVEDLRHRIAALEQ
jgi:chaperone modulatory protein CbpM